MVRVERPTRGEFVTCPSPSRIESQREIAMVRCPICESVQIGFLVSPRRTSCYYCGATWLQDESQQTAVLGSHLHGGEVSPRWDGPELRAGGAVSPLSPGEGHFDLL
jgi:ribosomal protein S27E